MYLKSKIWAPHFWFVLHTIAFKYPVTPNKVTKKKYYDMIINIPLFLPNKETGSEFIELLDKYPVTPYLDSREAFIKWTHFIHNRVNEKTNIPVTTYSIFLQDYYDKYKEDEQEKTLFKYRKYIYFLLIIIIILAIILYFTK